MTIQLAITEDVSDHMLGKEAKPCWYCGKPTLWLELSFEVNLHPGRCSDAMWVQYPLQSKIRKERGTST